MHGHPIIILRTNLPSPLTYANAGDGPAIDPAAIAARLGAHTDLVPEHLPLGMTAWHGGADAAAGKPVNPVALAILRVLGAEWIPPVAGPVVLTGRRDGAPVGLDSAQSAAVLDAWCTTV